MRKLILFLILLIGVSFAVELIIPGKSAGNINLGESIREVISKWGEGIASKSEKNENLIFMDYKSKLVSIVISNGYVDQIIVCGNEFVTFEGIRIGNSESIIISTYGNNYKKDYDGICDYSLDYFLIKTKFIMENKILKGIIIYR